MYRRTAMVSVLALAWGACRPGPKKPEGPGRDTTTASADTSQARQQAFKTGRIAVRQASLRLLDSAGSKRRALLEVRYGAGIKPGGTVTIRPDDREVVLRDDGTAGDRAAGDSTFSAQIEADLDAFGKEQERLAPALRAGRPIPEYVGRVQVRRDSLHRLIFLDIRRLRALDTIVLRPLALVDPNLQPRSLMVVDPSVVTDPQRTFDQCGGSGNPTGVWTFGHLITEMANQAATGIPPATFVRNWLGRWETDQTVNGFTIKARTGAQGIAGKIIAPWEKRSGGSQLDLTKAPFRLLAIVNRVDLRQNLIYGGGSAGEARFVFGALDMRVPPGGTKPACTPLPFTVIFEYGITKGSCFEVKAWAKQWYDLKALAPSDPNYRTQLEAITEQFVKAGADPTQSPNGNALNQLRTNERAIGVPWELREFALASAQPDVGQLVPATVKQEPDQGFNNGPVLADYVNTHAGDIILDRHKVPEQYPLAQPAPFLGASAPIPNDNTGFFWGKGADMTTANSRFHLSLNTCSGCHTGETDTKFTHIDPTTGPPAHLSDFLTNPTKLVHDPDLTDADNSDRTFGDLQRRALDLDALANGPCLRQIGFRPIALMVH